jgi:hypothetical protein
MFMLTMGAGMDLGFPDVCITPVGPVPTPIPYPNIAESVTTAPTVDNVLIDCMPVINTLSMGLVSEGDDTGVEMGVVSHMISGETNYEVGCFTIFVGGLPAQRLTSVTGQNSLEKLSNGPGMCLVPSQITVLALG